MALFDIGKHPELIQASEEQLNVPVHPACGEAAFEEMNTNVKAPAEFVAVMVHGVLLPVYTPINGAEDVIPSYI